MERSICENKAFAILNKSQAGKTEIVKRWRRNASGNSSRQTIGKRVSRESHQADFMITKGYEQYFLSGSKVSLVHDKCTQSLAQMSLMCVMIYLFPNLLQPPSASDSSHRGEEPIKRAIWQISVTTRRPRYCPRGRSTTVSFRPTPGFRQVVQSWRPDWLYLPTFSLLPTTATTSLQKPTNIGHHGWFFPFSQRSLCSVFNPENDTMDDTMLSPFFELPKSLIEQLSMGTCLFWVWLCRESNHTTSLSATDLESSVARLDGLLDFLFSVTVPCPFRLGSFSCATGEHWKMQTGEVMWTRFGLFVVWL